MKKLFALFLALIMALSLVACGGGDTATEETTDDTATEETTDDAAAASDVEIAVVLKTLSSEYWGYVKAGCDAAAAELGVEVSEEKKFCPAAKTIKDALCHTDNYPKDWDSFIGALKGNIIPQSSSFGITLDRKVIGYLEGTQVREANGSLGILVTEGKIAVSFEGKEK